MFFFRFFFCFRVVLNDHNTYETTILKRKNNDCGVVCSRNEIEWSGIHVLTAMRRALYIRFSVKFSVFVEFTWTVFSVFTFWLDFVCWALVVCVVLLLFYFIRYISVHHTRSDWTEIDRNESTACFKPFLTKIILDFVYDCMRCVNFVLFF